MQVKIKLFIKSERIFAASFAVLMAAVLSSCSFISKNSAVYSRSDHVVVTSTDSFDEQANFQQVQLKRVVDGDTIIVNIDGESCRVRLIGINTPESVAPQNYLEKSGKENTEEGKKASKYTKELLADNDTLYLQKDISDKDKYNRLLRYVWLEKPDDQMDIREVENKMLNAMLIKDGIADVEIYQPDDLYEEIFYEIARR